MDKLSQAIRDNQAIELTAAGKARQSMTPGQVKKAALDYKKASSKSVQKKGAEIDDEW